MRERILIVDIGGSAGDLPDTTPAATRYVNWLPQVSTAANIPAPGGFAVKALTDAVLLTWASVAGQSMRYGIESALDVNGQPGSWQVVTETDALRYTASVPDAAARWWRVRAISLGKAGAYTAPQRAVSISGAAVQQAVADAQAAADTAQSGVNSHAAQLVHAQQERDRIAQESLQRDIQGGLDAAADAKNKADAAREAAYLRAQTLFGEAIAAAAADATIKANGARDAALARINTIESQVADILSADAHSASKTYPAGDLVQHADKLYRAKKAVPTGIAITNAAYWEYIGDYTSLGEAVSACIAQAIENRTALGIERARLNGIAARMPAGTDGLATQAMVLDEMSARLEGDEALAGRASLLEASTSVLVRNADFEAERVWAFDAGDDGWRERTANNSAWTAPAHAGSAIRAVRTPAHSIMLLSPLMSGAAGIDGSKNNLLRFRFRTSHGRAAGGMAIYFQTDAQQMAEVARVNYAAQAGTDWQTVTVDMSANARWVASPVRRIRIDNFVCREPGEWVEIDYVAIGCVGVGISRDAVQQVNARIAAEETARARDDEALARRVNIVEARMPTGTGKLATSASVTAADNASVQRDNALANRATAIEARMPTGTGKLATEARVAGVERAAADANQATADRATQLETRAGEMQAAITGLQHTVSNDRQSAAERMDTMQADINGRATAGAVDAVTVRVNKLGGGGNLLPNSGFERNADNWRTLWNQHNIQPHVLRRDLSAPDWCPTGLHTIGQHVAAVLPQDAHIVAVAPPIPVEPGKTYGFAGHIAQHRCDSGVGIRFLSADYTELLSEPTNLQTGHINGGKNIADWRRVHVAGVAPAGAVWAQPAHWIRGRGQGWPHAWLCQPMFCALAEGQTEPPPYAPGGNELSGDFASEVQRISSIHAAVTDPSTGLARAHGRVDELAQVVADNEYASSQRIINVESNLNTVRNGAGGGNLLRNSTFERDLAGWVHGAINSPAQPVRNAGAPDWQPTGINTLALRSATQPPAGGYAEMFSGRVPVSGGETVAASLYAAAHRCTARAWIIVRGADGNWAHSYPLGHSTAAGGADLRDWARISTVVQLPPDARSVQLLFRQSDATAADPVAWMCQPMLCRVLPDATDAPPYSPGGSEYAQAVLELKTEVDTAKNERRAIAGLYVTANGKIGGFRTISDGITARFDVSADIFTVTSDAAQGLEWQAGCLRSYNGVSQAVLGHGFGEANDLALYIGPNTGRAAARKQDATLWADTAGNAGFSGVVHGSVISGSAMTLESLRIRVGEGKYAPFTICDTASDFSMSTAGTRVMTSTCSGFVAPDNGTGYHHKRFGRHRQDVQMHINLHTDHGWEDVVLEVQYNGGGWQTITHTSIDGGYRNSATYLVRYTTIDNWQTVAFRARTVRGKTTCLTLRIDIANYNESGNPPGSHSNMFSPGGTGGQTPAPPPPPPREPRPPRNGIWEQEP